jgi:Ni,Fe-hydrogenase maturation factor
MSYSPMPQAIAQPRFLIIGYGNELRGDAAVGPKVAEIVSKWQLPSVKTIATQRLTPDLVNDIAIADYVIFVDACSAQCCARTVQLDPIVVGSYSSRTLAMSTISNTPSNISADTLSNTVDALDSSLSCHPLKLLTLAKQLYGQTPQAWLLQVPTERFDKGKGFSSVTQRGCDQAVRTIEQFWKTYQQPVWMSSYAC